MADETDETDETVPAASDEASDEPTADPADDAEPTDGTAATPGEERGTAEDGAEAGEDDGAAATDDVPASAGEAKAAKAAKAGTTTDAKPGAKATDAKVVARRTVTSKRVTPKGGQPAKKAASNKGNPKTAAEAEAEAAALRARLPSQGAYAKGPSPMWVPILMFGLLIVGALVIMGNYMGVFGTAENIRLVIGLAFILGGIVTATQYR